MRHYTVKNNYSIWSKKRDRSVKRVKSYSKWSESYSTLSKFHSISSKILPFFTERSPFYSIWSNYFLQCIFLKLFSLERIKLKSIKVVNLSYKPRGKMF